MKTPCITFENVTKIFDMRLLYKNINFELQFSDIVLLTGNNGTGKSTLLRMAADLCRPTLGKITYHVEPRNRAYLGHTTFIYPQLTAFENLEFWTKAVENWTKKMHGVQFQEDIKNSSEEFTQDGDQKILLPYDLETKILSVLKQVNLEKFAHDPAGIFSRGMSQRLNIARVLLQDPQFLLLDEPCTGLDTESKEIFYTCIKDFTKKNACILWVSHDAKADSIYATHRMHIERQAMVMTKINKETEESSIDSLRASKELL